MQDHLDHLKLLIIDEISFVGADMLYRIHYRLKVIFKTPDHVLFGGLNVLLVGDLLQLAPVQESLVFKRPNNFQLAQGFDVLQIWEKFEPIVLKQNHRQHDAKEWADCLNRLRVGIIIDADVALLESRVTTEQFLDQNSIHVFYMNKDVTAHNKRMLEVLSGILYHCKAINYLPGKNKKVFIKQNKGTVGSTEFLDVFSFKIGARCMLNYNVDLIDNLFNGATGKIVGIEIDKEGTLQWIIVKFDDESYGRELRGRHSNISKKYENVIGTPIQRYELEYHLQTKKGFTLGAKAKVIQFPLKINYAQTAHKMQVILKNIYCPHFISIFTYFFHLGRYCPSRLQPCNTLEFKHDKWHGHGDA